MAQRKKHKICLVGECLSDGGAEKVQAVLSDYFTKKGIEVHHVIFISRINYTFSGRLLNLGEYQDSVKWVRNLKKFLAFRRYLKKNHFTAVIDSRVKHSFIRELLMRIFIYPRRTFFVVHSSEIKYYLPNNKWLANLFFSSGKRVIAVSNGISSKIKEVYGWSKVQTIHNPINSEVIQVYSNGKVPLDYEYVLFVGRLEGVKQVDRLINSYMNSNLRAKGIKLVLLGKGKSQNKIIKHVGDISAEKDVIFEGFQTNPYSYMKHAKYLILSSEFEGFGNVLVESLACGTPVISFDCESGPREIISNEKNGLLVKDQDFEALTLAMNRFVEDEVLYTNCKNAAQKSVEGFHVKSIGEKWLKILGFKSVKNGYRNN